MTEPLERQSSQNDLWNGRVPRMTEPVERQSSQKCPKMALG